MNTSTNYTDNQKLLNKFTVAIAKIDSDGPSGIMGTGFIVTDQGLIITNYHIIGDKVLDRIDFDEVDVYLASGKIKIRANVIKKYCDSTLDVAFLQLQEQLPSKEIAVACLDTELRYDHKLKMFGFREPLQFEIPGIFADVTNVAEIKKLAKTSLIDAIQFESQLMGPGFSGSAIVDLDGNRVVGIVFEQPTASDLKSLGFAIPIKSIIKLNPILSAENPGLSEDLIITDISKIFQNSGKSIQEFETEMNNEMYDKILSKACSLSSLLAIGSTLWQKIKNEGDNAEQIAFKNLLVHVFDSARQVLQKCFKRTEEKEDLQMEGLTEEESERKVRENRATIKNTLISPFETYREWKSYLPDHPSVSKFRDNIANYLKDRKVEAKLVSSFIKLFNLQLNDRVNDDTIIGHYYSWWTKKRKLNKFLEYLEDVKAFQSFLFDWDRKPLKDYYIPSRAFLAPINTWEIPDEKVEDPNYFEEDGIREAIKIVEELLLNEKGEDWYTFIGGTWGIGKTTLCKFIASALAQNYLWHSHEGDDSLDVYKSYIPIYCPLSTRVQDSRISRLGNIENTLEAIYSTDVEHNKDRKVLLILDGLNEYPDSLASLMSELNQYRSKYNNNIKTLITTRVSSDSDALKIKNDICNYDIYGSNSIRYIRLLQFTEDQADRFFDKYGVKGNEITYDYATTTLNWDGNQVKKPLFTWMLAVIYSNTEQKIRTNKNWGNKYEYISRTLIYFSFINNVIRKGEEESGIDYKYKQIPRIIAVLKHIHKSNLVMGEVQENSGKISIKDEIPKFDPTIDPKDLESLQMPYLLQTAGENLTVDFVHQTFNEYFLAEYYLDAFLNSKSNRLNVLIPSSRTVSFLEGLVYLLNEDSDSDKNNLLKEFVKPAEAINVDGLIKRITRNALDCIVKETALDSLNKNNSNISCTTIKDSENIGYEILWIDRWISILVLNILALDKSVLGEYSEEELSKLKDRLVTVITCSGKLAVPSYIKKLNNFDLADVNLIETNLYGADFSGNKKLICTNFFYAKLSYADFSDTDLSLANFWRANLKNIKFSNATLYGANFYVAEMRGSNLTDAIASYCELSGANLSRSDLVNVDLSGANLSNADLSAADLSGANLSNADLSGANLSNARLLDIKEYVNLKCHNANVNNVITNDSDLLDYLKKESAVPDQHYKTVRMQNKNANSLTGIWRSNDGGTYYLNHIESKNLLWFLSVSNAGNFAGIFRGEIVSDFIEGEWADVPLGEDLDYGKLSLEIKCNDNLVILLKTQQTGGYGATIWKTSQDLPSGVNRRFWFDQIREIPILHTKNRDYGSLTGIWRSSNGEVIHYAHEVGNYIWSCGISEENKWVNVFRGVITGNIIEGEWADVYRGNNEKLNNGTIDLKIQKAGSNVVSFKEGERLYIKTSNL
jgi:uncharacterized protein YjbI with pentapeptide repeats